MTCSAWLATPLSPSHSTLPLSRSLLLADRPDLHDCWKDLGRAGPTARRPLNPIPAAYGYRAGRTIPAPPPYHAAVRPPAAGCGWRAAVTLGSCCCSGP